MDIYKLNSTVDATKSKPVVDFFTKIEDRSAEFEQFYDWKINDREKFGWMMTVDALFLYQFLKNGLHLLQREATLRHSSRYGEILTPTLTSIRCDIMKLENQIPLSLLREIDINLKFKTVEDFLKTQISQLSCFLVPRDVEIRDYEGESHLLGCMHKYLSFLQIHKTEDRNPSFDERFMTTIDDMVAFVFALFIRHPAKRGDEDFLDKYNAKELAKAGIKFKPGSVEIRFDKHSDTLFLPKIVISYTYTEVMLRNLLALEFNETNRAKHVTQYIELMDCLIDTPEDVALLRNSHVIKRHSMMITDEHVAKMWDGMAKPMFFAGFLEHAQEVKAGVRETLIKNYYKSKLRNWWADFHWEHLSTPWKAVALLIAILVVGLTAAQTYCAFAPCQKK